MRPDVMLALVYLWQREADHTLSQLDTVRDFKSIAELKRWHDFFCLMMDYERSVFE